MRDYLSECWDLFDNNKFFSCSENFKYLWLEFWLRALITAQSLDEVGLAWLTCIKEVVVGKKVNGYFQDFQDLPLQRGQFRDKPARRTIGKGHVPTYHIFEGLEHVLSPWIANVFSIGHEVVQSFIPDLDVFAGRSFNKDSKLKGYLKKKQIGFDPFGRVYINRFQLESALGPAVDMLGFVLVFMGHHRTFDGQVFLGFVGDQGIIAAPIQGLFKGGLIK